MDISVVIVNYNVKYFLAETIYSVKRAIDNSPYKVEIIVVDNDSKDGSIDFVNDIFDDITFIENKNNVGFSIANNQGVSLAKGKYVLILNPDTIIEEETFNRCYDFMLRHTDVGALGVKMIDGGGQFLAESKRGFPSPLVAFAHMFGLSRLFPKSQKLNQYHLGYLDQDSNHEIDVLAGAFMFIPKSVYLEVGGFDEQFFMYGEDIDLSYRIKKLNKKIVYLAGVSIIHFKGESTKKGSLNYVKTFYEAMQIFARKHFRGSMAWLYIFVINIAIYFQAFVTLSKGFIVTHLFVLSDIVLYYLSFYGVAKFWAIYYFNNPNYYDNSLYYYNFPIYIVIIMCTQYVNGLFLKPFSLMKLLRSAIFGLVIIAAVYGFFEESFRSSRIVILFGVSFGTLAIILSRYLVRFIKYKDFDLNENKNLNKIVIGDNSSLKRVKKLFGSSKSNSIVGFVNYENNESLEPKVNPLGLLENLKDILKLYKIDEIIFDRKLVSSHFIIEQMKRYKSQYRFLLLSMEGSVIIGSSSSKNSGEWVAINQQDYNLLDTDWKRQKRLLDVIMSSFLILATFPVIFYQKNKMNYISYMVETLIGKRTFVGYNVYRKDSQSSLPILKKSVISANRINGLNWISVKDVERLNRLYAKNYTVLQDFKIIKSNFPYFT